MGVFYNIMIENSDIRFSYEQKNQYLTDQPIPSREKLQAGKLVSRHEENQPLDEQQDDLITKKSIVINGETLKNSQIYSRIRFNRSQRNTPKKAPQEEKYSFNQQLSNSGRPLNEIVSKSQNEIEHPRNLPKITSNLLSQRKSATPNSALRQSFHSKSFVKEQENNLPKGRSFSINHYDIYKPGFLMIRQELSSSRKKYKQFQEANSEKNSSFAKSERRQQLAEEKPMPAININFQTSTDRDLPQLKQHELQPYNHNPLQTTQRFTQFDPESNLHTKIERQPISVKNPIKREESSALSRHKQPIQNKNTKKESTITKKQQNGIFKEVTEDTTHKQSNSSKQTAPQTLNKPKALKAKINDQEVINHIQSIQTNQDQQELLPKVQQTPNQQAKLVYKVYSNERLQPKQFSRKKQENGLDVQKKQQITKRQKEEIQYNSEANSQREVKDESQRNYEYHRFSSEDYMKIYQILKGVHTCLKAPVLDGHALLKEIKIYLETVAGGSLDHIQAYSMPLHRLKIIKSALLYQRIAVVIISFAFAVGKTKQCLKYLINLISYCTSNTLLILKILESCEVDKQGSKNPIIAKSDRLILKRNFDTVRNSNDIILDSIFKISKSQEAFYDSFKDIVKSVGKNSLQQTFYNVLQYFSFFLCVSSLHKTIPFLAVAPNPYLRETLDKRPTLVIDIVQVFCHGTRKSRSHIFRPHTQYFLSQMSQYYEIVSFTCAYPNQIDKIIDILDPHQYIKHRLYRHHALTRHNFLYKDTERLGRDIHKIILLDSEENVLPTESMNTIIIPPWKGSKNDTTLAELCPILATIAVKNIDCLQAVTKINQQHLKNQSAGIKYLNFGINLD